MKKYLLLLFALLIAVGGYYLYELDRSLRRAKIMQTMNSLLVTYQTLERTGRFTNEWPQLRIYPFTNHYELAGISYQCVIATGSWDKKASNVLALTTNKTFILIGGSNGPISLVGLQRLPDWFW